MGSDTVKCFAVPVDEIAHYIYTIYGHASDLLAHLSDIVI